VRQVSSSHTFKTYPAKLTGLGMSCLPRSLAKLRIAPIQGPKLILLKLALRRQLIRHSQPAIVHIYDDLATFNVKS
jgi:hypothetical protein